LDNSTGLFPKEIGSGALNKWLFNKDTVNKVLDAVMEHGLKIQGGDELGRTIVFAANQSHAEFIVECFNERYPEKPSGYIAAIHNQVSHNQSLIEKFCDHHKENLPQIAVSVDMMDTGIDAPRTLNLVFFKVVRSYAKFWQMIGRGTRLCPDVFGPGQKKEHFLIFDVCENFEFFEENQKGKESNIFKPLTAQIFESRLLLSRLLLETDNEEDLELSAQLRDVLQASIKHLDRERFQVRMKMEYVDRFEERSRWNNLSEEDVHDMENHLSTLPIPETVNEIARRFDLMMLKYQIGILMMNQNVAGYEEKFQNIAEQLSKKYSIPHVLKSKVLIESMKDPEFYKALKQKRLEEIRQEIRELVQYLESETKEKIYTNIEDSPIDMDWEVAEVEQVPNYLYKSRVESYIRKNKNHITISKIQQNKPISTVELEELERILFDGEERGTRENYEDYGEHQPLGTFIRSIIGLDELAAQEAFADLLSLSNLQADQITFIQNIIKSLTVNGVLDKRQLFEPPFTNQNDQGLMGVFDDAQATKIISIIDEINQNAMVG
jgi:type I restriction enzyme R subunit